MRFTAPGLNARAAAVCALVFAASALLVACASVLGFERLEPGAADAGAPLDTGTDSGADTGADARDPRCSMLGLPGKVPSSPPIGAVTTYVLAVSEFDVGISLLGADAIPTGLNLDQRCTGDVSESSCRGTAAGQDFSDYLQDKAYGVDNAGFNLLKQVRSAFPSLAPENIQANLLLGQFGIVMRIQDYNGAANDSAIDVAIQPALGVSPNPKITLPVFSTSQTWIRDSRFSVTNDANLPTFTTGTAYIVERQLVARFKDLTISVPVKDNARPLDLALNEVYLTGNLRIEGTNAYLDEGLLAGRWSGRNALGAIGELRANFGSGPVALCTFPQIFAERVVKNLCPARDLPFEVDAPSSATCESISVGIRITAKPAKVETFENPAQAGPNLPEAGCPPASCP